jgi:hypothetical protein
MNKLSHQINKVSILFALALVIGACDIGGFFSTSWAPENNRLKSAEVKDASSAKKLLAHADGDPAASKAILDKIADLVKAEKEAGNPVDPELLGQALVAGLQASDVTGLLLGSLGDALDLLNGEGDDEGYIDLLVDLAKKGEANHLTEIADELGALFDGEYDETTTPGVTKLPEEALEALGETDAEKDTNLGLLALALIAGEIDPDSPYLTGFKDPKFDTVDDVDKFFSSVFPGLEYDLTGITDPTDAVEAILNQNPSLKLLDAVVNSISSEEAGGVAGALKSLWKALKGGE